MTPIPATAAHMAEIAAIYAHHVRHGMASFDEVPPGPGELDAKRRGLQDKGYPFLVLMKDDRVAGYAYAGPFRARSGYRFTAEDSIYLHPDFVGQGLARPLLEAVITVCRERGMKTMLAVCGMPQEQVPEENPSYRAHAKLGFVEVGSLPNVGYKFERWLKTVYLALDLS